MGYWTITIEGTGAHHNPDFEFDANRMANELVLQLKAHGADIRRASFLFDYKGDDAGDTLPYVHMPWPTPNPNSIEVAGEPYSVVRIQNAKGSDHFRLAYNGTIEKRGYWHTDPKFVQGLAELNNLAAAKQKPVSGGSDLHTTYEDRPEAGIVYRGRYIDNSGEPDTWEETYDLDLGSDVFLAWTHGHGDPEGSRPIGAVVYYREPKNPSGWMSGGVTFSTADPKWIVYVKEDGTNGTRPTWEVQSWEPLTITPSLLFNRSMESNGYTPKHGFIRYGKWVEA